MATALLVDSGKLIEEMENETTDFGRVAASADASSSELNSYQGTPLEDLTPDQVCAIGVEGDFATLHARSKEIGLKIMKFVRFFERYKPIVAAMKAKFAPRRGSHARIEVEPGVKATWAEYCDRYYGVGYRWVEKQLNGDYVSVPNEDAAEAAGLANLQPTEGDPATSTEIRPGRKDKIIARLQHQVDDLTAKLASAVSVEPEPHRPPTRCEAGPKPTLAEWRDRKLDVPEFEFACFREASAVFMSRWKATFEYSSFRKVFARVGDPRHAQNLAAMAAMFRSAADNLAVLAEVVMPEHSAPERLARKSQPKPVNTGPNRAQVQPAPSVAPIEAVPSVASEPAANDPAGNPAYLEYLEAPL